MCEECEGWDYSDGYEVERGIDVLWGRGWGWGWEGDVKLGFFWDF